MTTNHTYKWYGKDTLGNYIRGEITAINEQQVEALLFKKQITLLHLHKTLFSSQRKLKPVIIQRFYRQLANLIAAHINLAEAILILAKQAPHQEQKLYLQMADSLSSGIVFSETLARLPYFNERICQLIQIAESTGTLDKVLLRIADETEKKAALIKTVKQALIYPLILVSTAFLMIMLLLFCVIPKFEEIFANFQIKLPLFTQIILAISHQIPIIFLFIFILISLPFLIYKYLKSYRLLFDKLILKSPIYGNLAQKVMLFQFAQTLALMLNAGLPILSALQQLKQLSHNKIYQNAVMHLHQQILQGNNLYKAMQQHFIFNPLITSMVFIGEESGKLEQMLAKCADFFEADIALQINQVTQLLEPLIIVILGVLIGSLVIGMYLPIFKLGTLL